MEMASVNQSVRSSNIELYRIVVMLLIVAHHYVVNSGLFDVMAADPLSVRSMTMLLFGAWGKTGINCFVLITGYFMCRSSISFRKFAKLIQQIVFYNIIIYLLFVLCGRQSLNIWGVLGALNPVRGLKYDFTSCFIVFWLLIPYLNKLINQMSKEMHARLLILLVVAYSLLPNHPGYSVAFNYVSWFCILYIVASYIRIHGFFPNVHTKQWGLLTLLMICISSISVYAMSALSYKGYINAFAPFFFVEDSNKLLPLTVAVTSFMYFKDIKIPYSPLINAFGAATFGVLLIHANSDTMREWLWKDTLDCAGHYMTSPLTQLIYAVSCVCSIFLICAVIDCIRKRYLERRILDIIDITRNALRLKWNNPFTA